MMLRPIVVYLPDAPADSQEIRQPVIIVKMRQYGFTCDVNNTRALNKNLCLISGDPTLYAQ